MLSNRFPRTGPKSRLVYTISRLAFGAFVLLLLLILALPALAQDGGEDDEGTIKKAVISDDDVNKIARVVYCPVCESTPLDVCQTQACADWRQIIREMLEEGRSEQDIFNYFSNLYGDRVLAEPPREGFSLLVWLIPLITIPLGVIFFTWYMRTLRATDEPVAVTGDTAVTKATAVPNDYLSQIEKELEGK